MSGDPSPKKAPGRGLGRGLSALMGETAAEQPIDPAAPRAAGVRLMQIGHIQPNPHQPRRHFEDSGLDELAASIERRGLIQPIVVRPHPHNSAYQIVAGERRWRAAQRAQLHEVPVIVRELSDEDTLEFAIVENIQRQDLNAIEESTSYERLIKDYGHSQEELGKLLGKSRSHVANMLRLLDLPGSVQDMVADGRLSMGHARALITAPNPHALAEQVIGRELSVRETEKLAKEGKTPIAKPKVEQAPGPIDADVGALERQLGDILGLKVVIEHGEKGGRVSIAYSTLDQLDLVCQRLSGEPI